MGVGGQRHAPAALPPGKKPDTHCMGGWVGRRAGLDRCVKSRLPPVFDPQTVQPVASRYTYWAIAAHRLLLQSQLMTSLIFQITQHLNSLNRDVAVSVITSLWAGRPGYFGLIPGRCKIVISFPKCPAFCSVVSGGSYSPQQNNCEIKGRLN
jgi:hypothetical protein